MGKTWKEVREFMNGQLNDNDDLVSIILQCDREDIDLTIGYDGKVLGELPDKPVQEFFGPIRNLYDEIRNKKYGENVFVLDKKEYVN